MKPLCMTDREYELWREMDKTIRPIAAKRTPCYDCPLAFHLEMRAKDMCDGVPMTGGHPRAVPSDDPFVEARRVRQRTWWKRHKGSRAAA